MAVTLSHDMPDFEARFAALAGQKRDVESNVDAAVAEIIAQVRREGVDAILALTRKFDRWEATEDTLAFSDAEIDAAVAAVPEAERAALTLAAERIRAYHARQIPEDAEWEDGAGLTLGWRWTAVDAAGLYVPGGLASYPSSVLMNAVPAAVAGVQRLEICVPTPDGAVNPLVLLAARLSGVSRIWRIGGAQAVAAMRQMRLTPERRAAS
ncbi:MAG: histidinol dehydrogenase, partial [Pseudomonadota bacterium]